MIKNKEEKKKKNQVRKVEEIKTTVEFSRKKPSGEEFIKSKVKTEKKEGIERKTNEGIKKKSKRT